MFDQFINRHNIQVNKNSKLKIIKISPSDKSRHDCNALQVIYETHDRGGSGDLDSRLGHVGIGSKRADNRQVLSIVNFIGINTCILLTSNIYSKFTNYANPKTTWNLIKNHMLLK